MKGRTGDNNQFFNEIWRFNKILYLCAWHTVVPRTGDITVNICFDADRMDLLRVGILPMPERMATKRGAELVGNPNNDDDYHKFIEQVKRRDWSLSKL